ncbi:hypothetical protein DFH07DRAFT_974194 [Mycena maculata]|uniref:Uncharacterized protein n=1 Tax=Mycena maculata TaxID=230809 RepID=A0AAD7MFS5_9AGAR|nr:hypothetical protein DFH07DRAFT_974194 [Mycena maculata]
MHRVCGAKVPQSVWPIVITAIYIPIAIAGASSFSLSLQDLMNVLGYWLSIFVTVVLLEHFVFRSGDFARYHAAEVFPYTLGLQFEHIKVDGGLVIRQIQRLVIDSQDEQAERVGAEGLENGMEREEEDEVGV